MNESATPAAFSIPRHRFCWWWLGLIVLVAVVAGTRVWHLDRTADHRLFLRAKETFARGDVDTVRTAAEALRVGKDRQARGCLLQGMLFLRGGRLFEAIDDPANADLRYQLGQVALEFDKPKLARSWFLATLAMKPDHAGAREALRSVSLPPTTGQSELRNPR